MNFGIYLKAARERAGLSQKELADRLNVPQQSIGRYEKSDIDPRISFVMSVASVLGIGLDELMNYKPNKQQYYFDLLDKCGYTISNNPSLDYYTITSKFCSDVSFKIYKQDFCGVIDSLVLSLDDELQEHFINTLSEELQMKYITIPSFLDDLSDKLEDTIETLNNNASITSPNTENEKLLDSLKDCKAAVLNYIFANTEYKQDNKPYPYSDPLSQPAKKLVVTEEQDKDSK